MRDYRPGEPERGASSSDPGTRAIAIRAEAQTAMALQAKATAGVAGYLPIVFIMKPRSRDN